MANFHIFFYSINKAFILRLFKARDMGGSMIIFMFGAYFGLAMSWFFPAKKCKDEEEKDYSKRKDRNNYLSDLISMSGTLFLFAYWPSWNGA